MKKIILAIAVALAVACLAFGVQYKYGQCQAIAKSTGKRCLHGVSNEGDRYCWEHQQEAEAAALRERIETVVIEYVRKFYHNPDGPVQINQTEPVAGWPGRYCTNGAISTGQGVERFDVVTKLDDNGKIEVRDLTKRY